MKYSDIRKSLTTLISSKGYQVRYEDINKVKRPCFFIDMIDYSKEFNTTHRELKKIDFDILYFPSDEEGNNTETIEALEKLDDMFEVNGNKILKVLDRALILKETSFRLIDTIGHYMFSIELFDVYGEPVDGELMKELVLNFNNNKESE